MTNRQIHALVPASLHTQHVAFCDWDDLFNAVKSRLRSTVGQPLEATAAHDADSAVQLKVLECVAALDQLQATLARALGRCDELENELFEVRNELTQARAELAGVGLGHLAAAVMSPSAPRPCE